jgi:hypothetical protein
MSLLTLVQNVADRVGLSRPSAVVSTSDPNARQLLALAQQEGIELAKRHSWQKLTKEKTFTSTAAAAQTGAIPSDFDRIIDGTMYNRTAKRHLEGPLNAQEWQFAQAVTATTIIEAFRIRGNDILITPTPTGTSTTYAYEYVSTQWCESSGGTDQSAWAADTDVGILSEELMTLGTTWRWLKIKGLAYDESFRTYEMQVAQAIARDGGKPTLYAGKTVNAFKPRGVYVSEGNWDL